MRTGDYHVFRAKTVIVAAGGASHIFKPRAVGEGMGRTWYAPWSNGSAYALPIAAGAKMTQMENRIVLCRFKDGYGPVGAYFLHLICFLRFVDIRLNEASLNVYKEFSQLYLYGEAKLYTHLCTSYDIIVQLQWQCD